jgi:peptidoglycan hydrolase-like protein with peptidoglycan-binding domain
MRKLLASSFLAASLLAIPVLAQSSDTIRDAQQSLKDKGMYDGPVDGLNGPMTRAAVRKYQQQQNITPDGRLGPKTLDTLGVKNGSASTEFKTSGEQTKRSYTKGGKDVAHGGKEFGHEVAHGNVVDGSKDLGKGVGHGAEAVGVGTAHAAKSAAKGVGKTLFSDKHKDTTSTSH